MNLSWLLPSGEGIPVLMYHKVWPGISDALTITPEKLREQWQLLRSEGYQPLSLPAYLDIATGSKQLAGKPILLTFDDGYRNNLTYVYPLLKEFGWQATFFIITGTIDGALGDEADEVEQKMNLDELKQLDPAIVQLAMHGYTHEDMSKISLIEARKSLERSMQVFGSSSLQWHRVLAYPYGARPGKDFAALRQVMAGIGIKAAFRIGNKVSEVPAKDVFEMKRIDIKGTDTLENFRVKLKKGKLKPF